MVAVGNLYPVKDHATLLRALARLPAARVAIAGRGDQEEPLRRLAAELGLSDRVHLLGLRDDVETVFAAADVFVQPSLSEGLPLAVLEAMANGLPVVATRVGGIPEAVVDGKTGLLVPPGDPAALAAALAAVLDADDRGACDGRCRARARCKRVLRGPDDGPLPGALCRAPRRLAALASWSLTARHALRSPACALWQRGAHRARRRGGSRSLAGASRFVGIGMREFLRCRCRRTWNSHTLATRDVDHLLICLRRPELRKQCGISVTALLHEFVWSFFGGSRLEVFRRDDWRPFVQELRDRLRG